MCHLIRGSALELMLTKVLYTSACCQIIAMSATMSGLDTLRSWLGARLFVTNYRPVSLEEHIVINGKVSSYQLLFCIEYLN